MCYIMHCSREDACNYSRIDVLAITGAHCTTLTLCNKRQDLNLYSFKSKNFIFLKLYHIHITYMQRSLIFSVENHNIICSRTRSSRRPIYKYCAYIIQLVRSLALSLYILYEIICVVRTTMTYNTSYILLCLYIYV